MRTSFIEGLTISNRPCICRRACDFVRLWVYSLGHYSATLKHCQDDFSRTIWIYFIRSSWNGVAGNPELFVRFPIGFSAQRYLTIVGLWTFGELMVSLSSA
jgi:hypothetical protein